MIPNAPDVFWLLLIEIFKVQESNTDVKTFLSIVHIQIDVFFIAFIRLFK